MPASVFHRAPRFVSDHQVLLAGDAQAVLESMAPGSTGIARASGMAVRSFQAGYGLLEVHVRACRCLGLNPGQNPKVMNA